METSRDPMHRAVFKKYPFFDFGGLVDDKMLSLMMVRHDMVCIKI